jgi:hypothetical protein
MLAVPAAASAKTGSVFNMAHASGFVRVTFTGDSAGSCESFGVCGYSGTVTYRIGGKPKGTLVLARSRSGRISGGATYRTSASTHASVTAPAGGMACSATVPHRTDMFSAASLPNSIKTLLLSYDVAGDDILSTSCPGPKEKDAAAAGALPEGTFKASGFRGRHVKWGMGGGLPFTGGGFSANSEWSMEYKATGRSCNPRCAIPAHRPR